MPKKAVRLNGFGGGLNKDADLSDLKSEGRGEDEVATCENLFLDRRGKVTTQYPTIKLGNPSGGVQIIDSDTSASEPHKLIISDNKAYMGPGVYAVQNDINWSANEDFIIHQPAVGTLNDSEPDVHNSGIDLDVQVDTTGDLILFQGNGATFNSTGKGIIFGIHGDTPANVQQYLGDADETGLIAPGAFIRKARDTDTDGKWAEDSDNWLDGDSDPDDIEAIDHLVHASNTDITFTQTGGTYVDMSAPDSDTILDNDATGVNMDLMEKIQYWKKGTSNDAWNCTWRGGRTNFGDPGATGDSDTGGAGEDDTEQQGFFGKYYPNLDGRDIRIEIYSSGLPSNMDFLVIHYDCGGTGDMEFDYMEGSGFDSIGKAWRLSLGDLIGYGVQDGWTVIDIPWSTAYHTGGSFHPAKVKMIGLGISTDTGNWSDSDSVLDVRDFSIKEESVSLWDKSKFAFYQTSVNGKGLESIPHRYGSIGGTSSIQGEQYPFMFRLYKPNARWGDSDDDHGFSAGGGKIYYQELDDIESPRGDKLLLAEWHYDKGVKISTEDTFEPWDDNFVDTSGDTSSVVQWILDDPPVISTYNLESGYPKGVESVNALFKTSAVVGRSVYVGNVAKQTSGAVFTGKDHDADSDSGSTPQYAIVATDDTAADYITIGQHNHPLGDPWCDLVTTHGFAAGDYILTTGFATAANNGLFKIDSDTGFADVGTGTGSLTNNKVFINALDGGNAGLTTENVSAEIIGLYGFREFNSSLILKGAVGKKGGFPDNQYIDLELGSDSIQVMEGVGDRLLVFTENRLIVLNVAQDVEFMEADMLGYGVILPRQVTKIGEGIVLINTTGVHYFDGQKFTDLTLGKVDHVEIDPDKCAVMYDANRKLLYCYFDNADGTTDTGILYYSFITNTWVGNNHSIINGTGLNLSIPGSNSFIGEDGKAWHEDGGNLYYIGESTSIASNVRSITLETGKIDCGDIARNKRFYKLHISAKNGNTQIYISWRTDESSGTYTTEAAFTANEQIHTSSLTNAKGKWIQIKIFSFVAPSNFEIGDMSITYREKTLK